MRTEHRRNLLLCLRLGLRTYLLSLSGATFTFALRSFSVFVYLFGSDFDALGGCFVFVAPVLVFAVVARQMGASNSHERRERERDT